MKAVWVVYGMTGQYSDRCEWNVCGYATEELAQRHADLAQARADQLPREYGSTYDIPAKANQYDLGMQIDYTGTTYRVCMVEVLEAVPT